MAGSLTIIPLGGLANRMRALASAVSMAEAADAQICAVWNPTADCGARWGDLFQPAHKYNMSVGEGGWQYGVARKRNLYLPRLVRCRNYDLQFEELQRSPDAEAVLSALIGGKRVYVSSGYEFHPYGTELLRRLFTPRPVLLDKIDHVFAKFDEHTVGVHIRRGDNLRAASESPLMLFEERINGLVDADGRTKVFLCTDDESVKARFRELYGSRLITRNARLSRSNAEGLADAVVDMWSLSRTHHILGSYYSSFSDIAAELGGAKLTIVRR